MNLLSTRPNRWRPITVLNLLVGLFFSITALGQPAFLKEGLVAYYPFNGNANDESGNGRNGSANSLSFARDRINTEGGSANFNGSSSFIQISNTLPDSQELSFSVWINPRSDKYSGIFYEAAYYTPGRDMILETLPERFIHGTSTKIASPGPEPISAQNAFALNSWTHIVWTLGPSGVRLYRDGILIKSNSEAANNIGYHSDVYLGAENHGARVEYYFDGQMDDIRIYKRALSEGEVKALYNYELPQSENNLNPRVASATAQVVNGFVVGATITDGGYGYESNPVVTITGGGGTGAKATATQFNGVVTSITITNPGSGYTSTPTITIAPPPFPPRKATSTAQVVNGFVVGTKITDGGFGYDSPPAVLFVGGGGGGATAVATVASGVVTAITITNPGIGYTSAPLVRIASPPFTPKLAIETSKVYVRMSVVLGRKYQLEASTDLNTWTTTGPAFIAQDEELAQEFDVNQVGRYFRINQVP